MDAILQQERYPQRRKRCLCCGGNILSVKASRYRARKVMEDKLGRKLKPTEIVHHIDNDPYNNHPDNLHLFHNKADHLRYHKKIWRWVKDTIIYNSVRQYLPLLEELDPEKEEIPMTIDFTNIMKDKTAYFSEEEVNDMLNYCFQRYKDPEEMRSSIWFRNYMLILTLYRTGRRITEVVGDTPYTKKVGLRPCDLHKDGSIEWDILKKEHIKTTTKSGQKKSEETLTRARLNKTPIRKLKPVDKDFFIKLLRFIQAEEIPSHERVFQINRKRADQIVKYIAQKCRISRPNMKIHCHMFRHSYAIHLLQKNPNNPAILRYVQQNLDHSNINVTMTYAQFSQKDIRKILDKTFGNEETEKSKDYYPLIQSIENSDHYKQQQKNRKPAKQTMIERMKSRRKKKRRRVI
jgi:site-specific recombinase XerD